MNNTHLLSLLEKQRDDYYKLISNPISEQYQQMYSDIQQGQIKFLHVDQKEVLKDLSVLMQDTLQDKLYMEKISLFDQLDNGALIAHFEGELLRVFDLISTFENYEETQAIFIG